MRPESAVIKVTKKQKDAEREELQRVKIELKEAKATAARRLKEITLLEKFEPAALKREHETKAALLETLRQKQANDIGREDDLSYGTEEPLDLREGRIVQDLQVQEDDFQGNSTKVPEEDIVSCVKEEPKEEWVAVSYGSLMYVDRIVKESENIVTVRFLRRVDGCYQTMKNKCSLET